MATQKNSQDPAVERVNDEVEVGSDLTFQRRWWRFERGIWIVFTLLLIADLLGFLGRGYFARAQVHAKDGTMTIGYERIERTATPSILSISFGEPAIRGGKVKLWASESLIRSLGAQRVIPEPEASVIGDGGILYTFPATAAASIEFQLQPPAPGLFHLSFRMFDSEPVSLRVVVMP